MWRLEQAVAVAPWSCLYSSLTTSPTALLPTRICFTRLSSTELEQPPNSPTMSYHYTQTTSSYPPYPPNNMPPRSRPAPPAPPPPPPPPRHDSSDDDLSDLSDPEDNLPITSLGRAAPPQAVDSDDDDNEEEDEEEGEDEESGDVTESDAEDSYSSPPASYLTV